MTLIIGSEGSMGQRYKAILKHLGQEFDCYDLKNVEPKKMLREYSNFIIATPTDTHLGWIRSLDGLGRPILCEKPLSTDMDEVRETLDCKSPLSMMAQYRYLIPGDSTLKGDDSHYNYFRHGKDGLKWDCFQIIATARGKVELREDSPIWECSLNGYNMRQQDVDRAYVMATQDFLRGEYINRATLMKWHRKVSEFQLG